MKKTTLWSLIVLIIIVVAIVIFGKGSKTDMTGNNSTTGTEATPSAVPVIETSKVSSKASKFENAELGFAVNYPSVWQAENTDSGVRFIIPIDKEQVSTMATLQSEVNVYSGKCAFPAVVTVKDRGTTKIGELTANMISMSNTVQGRSYFNRMYSLQKDKICYMFSFTSIALSTESKGLTGSNITQAQNNNKAIVSTSDTEFTNMVKSFSFVESKAGQDETKVNPTKK
jgi:hypothetical protein